MLITRLRLMEKETVCAGIGDPIRLLFLEIRKAVRTVGLCTCPALHQQTGKERGWGGAGRGAKIELWISPPPSAHNNSMAMETPHVERWRGNIRPALFF